MTSPNAIPNTENSSTPTSNIRIDGKLVDSTLEISSILVTREVSRIASAEIVIFDGDPSSQDFAVSSSEDFIPGKKIEIWSGYMSQENVIFKGIIVSHSIQLFEDQPSTLKVLCKHEAVKLTVGRKTAYFYDQSDGDILDRLIRDAGIGRTVESTTPVHKEVVQYYSTDWDFIVTRAEANGMFVYTTDDEIAIKKPVFSVDPAVRVSHGVTILEAEAEMDARTQYKTVQAFAWQHANQDLKQIDARDPKVVSPGNLNTKTLADTIGLDAFQIKHAGPLKDEELQQWANAQWLRSQLSRIRGRVRFQGFDKIQPGDMIELDGLGKRFSGTAFVTGVRHVLDLFNWETDVSFGLDPKWFVQQYDDVLTMEAEGLLPGVRGLQIGIVTKLEGDPEGEERVRVRIPMLENPSGEGVWARVACLDAGENRGTFFRPEINDEVVVGFLHDDPRHPVILGQLNSSQKPAPVQATDDNHEKGIYTRDQLKLVFNDDEKSITIETPGGNSVVLSDQNGSITLSDQNSNKITMDSSGITIESASDLILQAGANIQITSSSNTEISASAQFKANGSAGSEVSAGGNTVIKGAIVQIN